MLNKLIEWCVHNRVFVCLLALILSAVGLWCLATTPIDALPDLSDTQVIINTPWQGRDPQTVEDQVTYPIASRMLAVPGVRDVRGYSFFGLSFVYVIFEDGADPYWARSRVLEYLSQARAELPEGVSPGLGPDASGLGWVFIYTLEDTRGVLDLGRLRDLQDSFLRFQLMSVPGVAEVASVGGAVRQYQVTVDPRALAAYGLSLSQIKRAIKRSNNDVGGRVLEMAEAEFMVRGRGSIKKLEDIEAIVLGADEHGAPILLRDVGAVAIGPDIKRGIADKNGQGEVVAGIVTMRYGENALAVIDGVKKKIAEAQRGLPEGVVIRRAYDRSGLIKRSIRTLWGQLGEELLIVALVCVVFLWHARSALVSVVTLPIAILMAFIAMRALGINANIMSLGGIAIAIGAMVDAAVVMVENLHKHKEQSPDDADHWSVVIAASREVGPALFFSLLVITVSFLPVFALQDQAGRLFKPLAYTKTFAMASAALVALLLTPIMMGFFVRGKVQEESKNPVSRLLIWLYRPALRFALEHRTSSIVIALLILAFSYLPFRRFGSEFMPPIREGDILFMPTTVPGLSSAEARRTLQIQDRLLSQFPEVETVLGKIGRADTPLDPAPLAMVETHVSLYPEEQWPERIIERGYLKDIAEEMLAGLRAEGLLASEVAEAELAARTEEAARPELIEAIRERLLLGADMGAVRGTLPSLLVGGLSAHLLTILESEKALAPSARERAAELLRAWRGRIDDSRVPLRRTSFEELTREEMERHIQVPGMPNWWLMPIETRLGMLTTGMRGLLGLKVYGTDLGELQRLGAALEELLKTVPGTSSAVAERSLGGRYLDIEIKREACARYGLTVGDVQDVIEAAIGGASITTVIEGRSRFPLNLRYPREMRDDPIKLGRVLLTGSRRQQVPLALLADIAIADGPPMIKSENGLLVVNIPVDLEAGVDIGGYVKRARAAIDRAVAEGRLMIPAGAATTWSGQYQHLEAVNERLRIVVPIALALIFLLIYLNMPSVTETLITMVTLPFALIGGVWYLHILGYDMSVAVVIGFIALAGLAAETAILMHVYLDLACKKRRGEDGSLSEEALREGVIEGAVLRVRPKMMTVVTTIVGLLPIMWASGAGSGPMKRMAAPMIGGLVSSTIHTLILIPVYYAMFQEYRIRRRAKRRSAEPEAPQ